MMKRLPIVLVIITAFLGSGLSSAQADHVCRRYYLDTFEEGNRQLGRELEARRDALQSSFEAERDAIRDQIRAAERDLRGREREDAVRHLHRELEAVDRSRDRTVRALHEEIEDRRRALVYFRDDGLRNCRTDRCTDACHVEPRVVPHEGEVYPAPHSLEQLEVLPAPAYEGAARHPAAFRTSRSASHRPDVVRRHEHGHESLHRKVPPEAQEHIDWRDVVLELIARRLGR